MGHQRRYYPSRSAYIISNRTAEGLPFVANPYVNAILMGIFARAVSLHPAMTICAATFLANHYHLLAVLNGDPNELKAFMNYIDGEIGKVVVRWLGKRNYKVWSQRYCCAQLLDSEAAFKEMLYLFANPLEANLCLTADKWTGCTTYYSLSESKPRTYKWIAPARVPRLPNGRFTKSLVRTLLKTIEDAPAPSYELPIEPFAWMSCFADTCGKDPKMMHARLVSELGRVALRCEAERKALKLPVAEPQQLAEQNPHRAYKPEKCSPRVFCISTCPELRVAFIGLFKSLCAKAEEGWQKFLKDFTPPYIPHGMFLPPLPARGSILTWSG